MDSTLNIKQLLLNEVCLEGLDGITLQALWLRISEVTKSELPFPESLEEDFWRTICRIDDFEIYELKEARADLVIYDRFTIYDENNENEMYYEPNESQEDIYLHSPVFDEEKGIIGSCASYRERRNITNEVKKIDYRSVKEEWGSKLVIVGKQDVREFALMGRLNVFDLNLIQYCLLERIGRSRYHGEITQGKRSLQVLGEDPKSLFYHRKALLKYKLITKQVYHQKCGKQNFSGTLLHLQRYYVQKKPKQLLQTEQIVEFLKLKPKYRALYPEVTAHLNMTHTMKKLFKSLEFQRFVRTDKKIPYKEFYPNATPAECKLKKGKTKVVRVMELIDPNVDVAEHWCKTDDVDDEEEESGFKNYENLYYGVSLLSQASRIVRDYGPNGCCQSELGQTMGQNKLSARSFCRNLLRRNAVTCVMNDMGRQRVTRFVSRKYENKGQITLQLKKEREKMFALLKSSMNNNETATNDSSNSSSMIIKEEVEESQHTSTEPVQLEVLKEEELIDVESVEEVNVKKRAAPASDEFDLPNKKARMTTTTENRILLEDIDKIDVKLNLTSSCPGLKGYSQGIAEQFFNEGSDGGKITYRLIKRTNFIMECVRQEKVIVDLSKLMKMIQEEEMREGYKAKIDKKSILRLLLKLAKDGHVKYIKATLSHGNKVKTINFICEPSIDENHSVIQSALEQAKMKFFINVKPAPPVLLVDNENHFNEIKQELRSISSDPVEYKYDRSAAIKYGFQPKMVRLRLIHELLFYLVYDHRNFDPTVNRNDIEALFQKHGHSVEQKLLTEVSDIYDDKEISWKMFIPPIPSHIGWPAGWTLICDVLLRLPLSIFVQCFHVPYIIDNMDDYLKHPIRKHLLVRHLPAKMRNALMNKRKYIFAMHEIVSRLCYMGLLQFGPQRLKEKDQVFIYLNRRTALLNTITSEPGYHQTSDMQYERHEHLFASHQDIQHYWYELWQTCMHTTLGGRLCVIGKFIVLEQLNTKPEMIEAALPRMPTEAEAKDNGQVPGDKRGAAGLDSALFAHLKRNWNWFNNTSSNLFQDDSNKKTTTTTPIQNNNDDDDQMMQTCKKHLVNRNAGGANKKSSGNNNTTTTTKKGVLKTSLKKRVVIREVKPKRTAKRKPFYDEIDKAALKKMKRLRTEWSPLEDHVLLLCQVASIYLCPNRRRKIISFSVVRDAMHRLVETSASKTSRACQRRIVYIMKNANTLRSVHMCLEEIRQNAMIRCRYLEFCNKSQNPKAMPDEELNIAFIELVCYISKIFRNLIKSDGQAPPQLLCNTIKELNEKYIITTAPRKSQQQTPHYYYKEAQSLYDIHFYVIRTVIHSSMCCTKDKTSWAYQLFKIYQQYPETLLRSVISRTRMEQMISLKKAYVRTRKKSAHMPLDSAPYQLSITYKHQLLSKFFSYSIFEEAYTLIKSFRNWLLLEQTSSHYGMELYQPQTGTATALVELTQKLQALTFHFDIPEDVIVLDQKLQNTSNYQSILTRYEHILNQPDQDDPDDPENIFGQNQQKTNQLLMKKTAANSRIAFYMMRAEMNEGGIHDDKATQHLHDFFVVNASQVYLNIAGHCEIQDICGQLDATNMNKEILSKIKRNAVMPKECPIDSDIIDDLLTLNANETDIDLAKTIIAHCLDSGILGLKIREIQSMIVQPYEGNFIPMDIVDILIDRKMMILSGVECARLIHHRHMNPWLINSCKILRLDREKIQPLTLSKKEQMNDRLFKHFSPTELHRSKQRLDLTSQQDINVVLCPWIRIDGSLNRRVLDRWLGSVLNLCLDRPGITLEALSRKFHFMRPVEIMILIKCLTKLECVKQSIICKPKTTLFSGIPTITKVPATGFEDPKHILIEPQSNAVIQLSVFIGDKSYATDFLL